MIVIKYRELKVKLRFSELVNFDLGIKHEDYNMMMDKMPPKCKLIPRKNLTNLSTVCFDMSVKMIGKLILSYLSLNR